jgi:hypothetical protein
LRENHRETCVFCLHQLIAGISHAQVVDKTISSGTCKNILNALSATSPLNGIVVKATRDNVTGTDKGYFLSGITLVSSTVLNVSYYDDYAFMGTNGIPASTDANFKYDAETGYDTRYTASAKTFLTGALTAKLEGSSTPSYLCGVMYFDHAGRLTTVKHKLNTDCIVTLTENTYDELGRLKTNKKNKQSAMN